MGHRRILITGAAGEIGRATMTLLRAQGHAVVGIDRQAAPELLVADVRDRAETQAAVDRAVAQLGGLDVLINNAGVAVLQDSGLAPTDPTRAMMDVNFFGTWNVTAAALAPLLASKGRIVNVASMLARVDMPFMAGYAASKRAIAALSDVLRVEYAERLSLVTVYPGYVKTKLHEAAHREGLSLDGIVPREPLPRVAESIARACTQRGRRDVAVSWSGAGAMLLARFLPQALDTLVLLRLRRLAQRGKFTQAALASSFVQRLTGGGGS